MPTPKLSIIVPVFYLQADFSQLEVWLRQLDELELPVEVILIQDGFSEKTKSILTRLARQSKEHSIKFFNVDFKSPASTRNTGLELAKGEWILFCDSDDYLHVSEVYQALSRASNYINALIGSFSVLSFKSNCSETTIRARKLIDLGVDLGWWRIAVRRERVGALRLFDSKMGEDALFIASLQFSEQEVQFSERIFYTYYVDFPQQLTSNLVNYQDLMKTIDSYYELIRTTNLPRYAIIMFAHLLLTALLRLGGRDRLRILTLSITGIWQIGIAKQIQILLEMIRLIFILASGKNNS